MKKIALIFIIGILSTFTFISCAEDQAEKRIEFAKIVESRTTQDKLNDLYVGSDGDIEALSRILKVTPSSIERLRKGETDPTLNFEERLTDASLYYFMNDQSFTMLRSVLDEEYGWYDSILNFPSHHPYFFWGINIVLILLLAFVAIIAIWPILIELLIFFIAWGASLIFSPDTIDDKYIDNINPVIETII